MKWNEAMSKLVRLSGLVADEKLEKTGLFGVLHFFKDGYVYGSNGFFEFELYYGGDFEGVVPAAKFFDVVKVLDPKIVYDVFVEDGYFVISGEGMEVKMNMIQVDGSVNRVVPLLSAEERVGKEVVFDWKEEVLKVLKKEGEIASSGSSSIEYRVICFDREGVFATDRVRIACYFVPFIVGEDKVLLSVSGVKQLVEVAEEERIVGAWVVGGRLYVKFDGGFYVGVLGYDMNYPELGKVLLGYKEKVERFAVDMLVADEISKIVKILDPSDVVYLVVKDGWLELRVSSLRGFEWKKKLQQVNVEGDYMVGVLARDLDGVIDGVVELGFSDEVIYCRSVEDVEYVVAVIS
jgi:hypothetical protein